MEFKSQNFHFIIGQLVLPKRRELVLDYVIERKRMDDLCSSIKDGRFKEQKVTHWKMQVITLIVYSLFYVLL